MTKCPTCNGTGEVCGVCGLPNWDEDDRSQNAAHGIWFCQCKDPLGVLICDTCNGEGEF